jgi:uncharacterized membrane protein
VDWKFWSTFVINVIGLGFMGWQVMIMKQQIGGLPSTRSVRRVSAERQITKRMYLPVFAMAVLIIISWLPYMLRPVHDVLPNMLVAWGATPLGCSAAIDTSGIVSAKDDYHLFDICAVSDSTVDPMENTKIAVSTGFLITGQIVQVTTNYDPNSPIAKSALPGSLITHQIVLLPKDQDGTNIRKLSDVLANGGKILVPGAKKDF